jgi:nucleoside-diphosphate-sugar epimerase
VRVLVTGSAGYIGSVLVPYLKSEGHEVLGYDVGWFGEPTGLSVRGDIRDTLVRAGWPEVVVHLAGLSNDPMGDLSPALTHSINKWGTIDLIQHHPRARHVVISSCAVYGQASDLCTEEMKPNPLTTYAECKAAVDRWVTTLAPTNIVLRLGTVYGWSPNHRLDLVLNKWVHEAVTKGRFIVNGNAARPMTHVNDVASAIAWAVKGKDTGIFNVVGDNVRMRELASAVANATMAVIDSRPGGVDARDYQASGSKLLAAGWHPVHSVFGSIPALVLGPTEGHVRLDQLKALREAGALDDSLRFAA